MLHLAPLWLNQILTWQQVAALDASKRPYLLPEQEFLFVNKDSLKTLSPQLRKGLLYLHRLLKSNSQSHLASLQKKQLLKHEYELTATYLSPRWRRLLTSHLSNLPAGPSPLQLLAFTRQPLISSYPVKELKPPLTHPQEAPMNPRNTTTAATATAIYGNDT